MAVKHFLDRLQLVQWDVHPWPSFSVRSHSYPRLGCHINHDSPFPIHSIEHPLSSNGLTFQSQNNFDASKSVRQNDTAQYSDCIAARELFSLVWGPNSAHVQPALPARNRPRSSRSGSSKGVPMKKIVVLFVIVGLLFA